MARPAKASTDKRTRSVNIALTEAEYAQFQALAGHGERVVRANSKKPMPTRQRSIAGLIRQLLVAGKTGAAAISDEERKALFQLAGMARNLDQLAAQANTQGFTAVALRTDELASQLRTLMSVYDRQS